jgi:hypothetical protein
MLLMLGRASGSLLQQFRMSCHKSSVIVTP